MGSAQQEIAVGFGDGKRVHAQVGRHTVQTDQPGPYGEDSAPAPFSLFLASLATCAGFYVLSFCQKRDIPTDGIRVKQRVETDSETGALSKVFLDVELPADFPEKYREAVLRTVDQCAVKRAIQAQPAFEVRAVPAG